jgi:hypothetical protein
MKKITKRVLSMILSAMMVFMSVPFTAFAAEVQTITAFAPLDITEYDVIVGTQGDAPENLVKRFPASLTATIDGQPVSVAVTWNAEQLDDGFYHGDIQGEFLYVSELTDKDAYELAPGVAMPQITVHSVDTGMQTVIEFEKLNFYNLVDGAIPVDTTTVNSIDEIVAAANLPTTLEADIDSSSAQRYSGTVEVDWITNIPYTPGMVYSIVMFEPVLRDTEHYKLGTGVQMPDDIIINLYNSSTNVGKDITYSGSSVLLQNGDRLTFTPNDLSGGWITIAAGAKVTLNVYGNGDKDHICYIGVGDNAHIVFTFEQEIYGADVFIAMPVGGKNVTLECTTEYPKFITMDTSFYENYPYNVTETVEPAKSVTLIGSGINGFTFRDSLETENLTIRGGTHSIDLNNVFWRYTSSQQFYRSGYGSPLDGKNALTLSDGGSLNVESGTLKLTGMVNGWKRYGANSYYSDAQYGHYFDPLMPLAGGAGIKTEGSATVNIGAGAVLEVQGGNLQNAVMNYVFSSGMRYTYDNIFGGPAIMGDVDINFAQVSGGTTSTLKLTNGLKYNTNGQTLDAAVDGYTSPWIVSDSKVTINKPAGNYLAGANWDTTDQTAYSDAVGSAETSSVTVAPKSTTTTAATAGVFTLSTTPPTILTYTAEQIGGAAGTADTEYIEVTFDQEVTSLISANVTLTGTGATAGTPVATSDSTVWQIPVTMSGEAGTAASTLKITGISGFDTVAPADQTVTEITLDLFKALTTELTFTATQIGGVDGVTDTEYIEIEFDTDIDGLTVGALDLTNEDGTDVLAVDITSFEQDPDNARKWILTIGYEENGKLYNIGFDVWAGAENLYSVTNTAQFTTYAYVHPNFEYTITQVGGVSGVSDTAGLLVTFDEGFIYDFSDEQIDYIEIPEMANLDKPSITIGDVTDNDDDNPCTWYIPLTLSDFVLDGMTISYRLLSHETDYDINWPENTYATIYRVNKATSFTIKSLGYDDEIHDTSFTLEFDTPVADLTADQVTVSGASVRNVTTYGVTGATTTWYVILESLNSDYDDEITVTVAPWLNYAGSSRTAVNKLRDSGFDDFLVTLASVLQVGGRQDEYGSYLTTEGIKLTFDKDIDLTQADIIIDGATAGTLTDNGDEDARTWFVPITDITVADTETITVTVGTVEEQKYGGTYHKIGDLYLTGFVKTVAVFISDNRYNAEVTYDVEQVGGSDGSANTEGVRLTIRSTHDMTADDSSAIGWITTEGFLNASPSKNSWGNTGAKYSDGGQTLEFYQSFENLTWENGDEISITIDDWTDSEGNTYTVTTDPESLVATTRVYKDTRTYIYINSAIPQGEDIFFRRGRRNDTEIKFQLSASKKLDDLTANDIYITSSQPDANIVRSTAADALTYDETDASYTIKLASVSGGGQIPFEISILPFGDYVVSNSRTGTLSSDSRIPVEVIAAEQIGGVFDETESTGILVTFSESFYDPNDGGIQNGGFSNLDLKPYFFLDVTSADGHSWVNYTPEAVEGRADQVLLKITNRAYSGNTIFNITAKPDEQRRSSYIGKENNVSVTLFDDPPPPDGRTLESIAPRGIYVDSVRKEITLVGEFSPNISKVQTVYAREANEPDPDKWITLPLTAEPYANTLTLDVRNVPQFQTIGEYEVCYKSYDSFYSEWRPVGVYDNEVYSMDGYGILAVTQDSRNNFSLQGFMNETEMKTALGETKPILVFRGGILKDGEQYKVQSNTVINNAVTYYDGEGDDLLTVRKRTNGDVEVYAINGGLRWKNIPITPTTPMYLGDVSGKSFEITLQSGTKYRTDRLTGSGTAVEIKTGVNDFSVNFVIGGATLASYKLYDGVCSLSGGIFVSVPEALAGALDAGIDVEELLLTDKTLPPLKASSNFKFKPGGMFGGSLGAILGEASLDLRIDTLPETRPHTFGASGVLDLADMLYVEGELVMAWGEIGGHLVIMPDTISLFARVGTGGVPLVPPTIVAYINGFGGSVTGLAQTVFGNFEYVPPVKVKAMGAVVDATGELFEFNKASFEFGIGSFSAYANEAKLLKVLKLEDVGYKFGIMDSETPSIYGIPSVDAYFGFGGSAGFDVEMLKIKGGLEANVRLRGNYLTDAIAGWTKDSMDKGGFTTPSKDVRKALYNAIDFDGRVWASAEINAGPLGTLAGAKGELAISKSKISGTVTGEIFPGIKKSIGVTYKFKGNDLKVSLFRAAINSGSDEVKLTNVVNAGSYNPNGTPPLLRATATRTMSAQALRAATPPPTAEVDDIATIFSNYEYDSVEVYKDGVLFDLLTADSEDTESLLGWFDTAQLTDMTKGTHSANYLITERGEYTFKVTGEIPEQGDTEFAYTLSEITPMPDYESVTTTFNSADNTITADWTLDTAAQEEIQSGTDIYTRLLLINAVNSEVVLDLTAPATQGDDYPLASTLTYTATLPDTLESGEYYVSAEIARKYSETITIFEGEEAENVTDNGYEAVSLYNTESFDYTNPEALSAPGGVSAAYAGNGAFEVTWSPVVGADGYRITVLNPNGTEIPGISATQTTTTSTVIQGGLTTTVAMDSETTDGSGDETAAAGLPFGNDYLISVKAIKNKAYSSEEYGTSVIAILGAEGTTDYRLEEPSTPELTVNLEDGNAIAGEDGSTNYYATNSSEQTLTVTAAVAANITVSVTSDGYAESYTSTGAVTSFEVPLSLGTDGVYNVAVTAETASGDSALSGIVINLDTSAPLLNVDESSFTAAGGRLRVNGFTELGATVLLGSEPVDVIGGLFEISAETEAAVTVMDISATDEAGNTTGRIINIPYTEGNPADPGDNPGTDPGDGDSGNDGDGNGGNNTGGNSNNSGYTPGAVNVPANINDTPADPTAPESGSVYDASVVIGGEVIDASQIVNTTGSLNAALTIKVLEEIIQNTDDKNAPITLTLKNAKLISYMTFDKLAAFADENGITLKIYADNYVDGEMNTRLYADVAEYAKTNNSLYLTTDPAKSKTIAAKFRKQFINNIEVISLRQTGNLKTTLEVAVKLGVIGKTDDLHFYYFNEKTNRYKRFKPRYRFDKNGFLHLFTNVGGHIIVSEGPLEKKV